MRPIGVIRVAQQHDTVIQARYARYDSTLRMRSRGNGPDRRRPARCSILRHARARVTPADRGARRHATLGRVGGPTRRVRSDGTARAGPRERPRASSVSRSPGRAGGAAARPRRRHRARPRRTAAAPRLRARGRQTTAAPPVGCIEHLGREVEPDDGARRADCRAQRVEGATGATTEVEHSLTRLERGVANCHRVRRAVVREALVPICGSRSEERASRGDVVVPVHSTPSMTSVDLISTVTVPGSWLRVPRRMAVLLFGSGCERSHADRVGAGAQRRGVSTRSGRDDLGHDRDRTLGRCARTEVQPGGAVQCGDLVVAHAGVSKGSNPRLAACVASRARRRSPPSPGAQRRARAWRSCAGARAR